LTFILRVIVEYISEMAKKATTKNSPGSLDGQIVVDQEPSECTICLANDIEDDVGLLKCVSFVCVFL
jgi:hypothetical protein